MAEYLRAAQPRLHQPVQPGAAWAKVKRARAIEASPVFANARLGKALTGDRAEAESASHSSGCCWNGSSQIDKFVRFGVSLSKKLNRKLQI